MLWACDKGLTVVAMALLERGADVNAKDRMDKRPGSGL